MLAVDLGRMPLAGGHKLPDDPSPELMLPLRLFFCRGCTLLQVLDVVSPEILFHDYRYASSVIPPLVRHFEEYADVLARLVSDGGLVVEFGANDGVLQGPLRARGVRAVGFDLADNIASRARARGLDVRTAAFDRAAARTLRAETGAASVVTGSNVFAHVDDVHEVVEAGLELLADDGLFAVEVHHVAAVLEALQYDTLYHEHLCEYSARSLAALFGRHGMELVRLERLPMHGGALRAFAARAGRRAVDASVAAILEEEERLGLSSPETWRRFGEAAKEHAARLRAFVEDERSRGRRVAGYGAAGRATILLNAAGLGPELMSEIYDGSPLRAGRLVPGVRIPVVPPERMRDDPPDVVLILAWNYAPDIVRKERWYLEQGGRFYVPLPELRAVDEAR